MFHVSAFRVACEFVAPQLGLPIVDTTQKSDALQTLFSWRKCENEVFFSPPQDCLARDKVIQEAQLPGHLGTQVFLFQEQACTPWEPEGVPDEILLAYTAHSTKTSKKVATYHVLDNSWLADQAPDCQHLNATASHTLWLLSA